MDFADQVVLVTGASAGIGEAIAELLAGRGARLALSGRNQDNLKKVGEKCRALRGSDVLEIVADLATDEGVEKTAKDTIDHFGRLDVLINNAGVGARTCLLHDPDMSAFDRVFRTNVRAVYQLTRLLAPRLVETRGNIVNISSVSGSMPSVGSLPYSMTKAALDQFTRCIALELAPLGVRVNAISPGITRSTFVQRLTDYTPEQYAAWLAEAGRGVPLGRAAEAREVAALVAAAAARGASSLTGAVIPVDGGLSLAGAGRSDIMTRQMK
ncbi:hypothetical protein JYU34_008393 [Plutella xylostella]|uniref:Ketoreductase domain-containing protein n=1 Tax=Plutella xylostella TaxID=51655 RepID=A0ABQ7QM44_PLUXY|nr:hypothetical protein JYU34_008393 [Plutella xylostella]